MEAVPILCNLLQYEDRQAWTFKSYFYLKWLQIHFFGFHFDLFTYILMFNFSLLKMLLFAWSK
jgi:hypothetical protein